MTLEIILAELAGPTSDQTKSHVRAKDPAKPDKNGCSIEVKPVQRASGLRPLASTDTTDLLNQSRCLDNGHRETLPTLELRHEAKAVVKRKRQQKTHPTLKIRLTMQAEVTETLMKEPSNSNSQPGSSPRATGNAEKGRDSARGSPDIRATVASTKAQAPGEAYGENK